ncbi:MAG: hypothetical protein KDA85_09670, partial [Planctomycetaceae bacterium]|nr:hypothetical protein [Planctomycetaceae bacterium]
FPILLNQQCLQAWHWLMLIMVVSSMQIPPAAALSTMRLAVCCIYIFSAFSRISVTVHQSMTGYVAQVLARLASVDLSETSVRVMCWGFVVGELLTGIALLLPRTRRLGIGMALLLHLLLLLALGPLGMNHHVGVLIWNLCMLTLVPVLFRGPRETVMLTGQIPANAAPGGIGVKLFRGAIVVFPVLGLIGITDNWPAWQLYSPRPEVWILQVHIDARAELPEWVQPEIADPPPLQDWCAVRLDRLSLSETGSPIYPEDRFQLAVIQQVITNLADGVWQVSISEPETAFWQAHRQRMITTRDELDAEADRFLLNVRAAD